MAVRGPNVSLVSWSVPECPFTIEYSARVLDDIRLTVTDAFFSLPRGGAEIGGILTGTFAEGRVTILGYAPLECEHAFGPSFTISLNDEVRLKKLLADAPQNFPGMRVLGWYHSHTRSGIFLSETDLEVYNLFFPERWQVAMVMKPHTFEPARIGFFFREADGNIHTVASYREDVVDAQPIHQVVPDAPPPVMEIPVPRSAARERAHRILNEVELDVSAEPVNEEAPAPPERLKPVPQAEAQPPAQVAQPEPSVPRFLTEEEWPARGRRIVKIVVAAALTLGIVGAAVQTRDLWMAKFRAVAQPAPAPPPPSMGLHTTDHDGQLEIAWDRTSPLLRQAAGGVLEISDGGPLPQSIRLDPAHLQTGTFTYGRQGEKVDVRLIVRAPDGHELREVTAFLGKLPERRQPVAEDEEARKERERLAVEAAKLKTDLNWQAVKTRKLEKDLQSVRDELRREQQKRLMNQAGR
ncbi:MAG TPA: hypothetical protein VMJ75_16570 [Candidatus Acidoferrales bacterium]|nr:hypothetical protein [Candidatus Acidoferrales bacterium]